MNQAVSHLASKGSSNGLQERMFLKCRDGEEGKKEIISKETIILGGVYQCLVLTRKFSGRLVKCYISGVETAVRLGPEFGFTDMGSHPK